MSLLAALLVSASLQAQTPIPPKPPEPPKDGNVLPIKPTKKISFETTEGTWISLDLSPDGKTVVFELLGDLYSMSAEGGEATRITSGTPYDGMPRFSPDGKKIAFISDRSGAENVWTMDPDGKNLKALTKDRNTQYLSPTWSPDGNYVVASKGVGYLPTFSLIMVDVRGGSGVNIVPAVANSNRMGAIFSPDGRYLYYGQRSGRWSYEAKFPQWQIYRFDRKTGENNVVTNSQGSAMRPMLTPDGKTLLFATRFKLETALRARDLKTGDERWVAFPMDRDDQESRATRDTMPAAAFTKDGKTLFTALGGKIQKLDIATGKATPVPFHAKVELDVNPSVHFDHRIDDNAPVRSKILRNARLSPDGKTLAFNMVDRLYTLDTTDPEAKPRRITDKEEGEFMPSWSPDSKTLVYVTWSVDGGQIMSVPATGGEPKALTSAPAYYVNPIFTPDGKNVVFLLGNRADGLSLNERPSDLCLEEFLAPAEQSTPGPNVPYDIRIMPKEGGESRLIANSQGAGNLHFANDPDILYVAGGGGLQSMRLDGLDRKQLITFTGGAIIFNQPSRAGDIRVSPDGSSALLEVDGQLYVATLPQTGEAITIPVNGGPTSVPIKKFSPLGGDYLAWSNDGKSATWAQGSKFYRQALDSDKPAVTDIKLERPRAKTDGTILLKNARLITMRGDEVIEHGDILIQGPRIAAIGRTGSLPIPPNTQIFDLKGKTVSPGYVDVHSHWFAPNELHLPQSWGYLANLAYGVTTNRDPQSAVTDIYDYQEAIEAGDAIGPRIFTTGPGFFAGATLDNQEAVKNYLTRYRDAYETKYIKEYVAGDRLTRQWTALACKELGLTPTTEGALDVKMPITEMIDGYSGHEHALPLMPIYGDLVGLIKGTETYYTPTLIVSYGGPFGETYWFENTDVAHDPKLAHFVPPSLLDSMLRRRATWTIPEEYVFERLAKECAKIVRAGGKVCMGSHGEIQGIGAHYEIWMLASGGMTPLEALRCATLNGAEAIGYAQDLGSLVPGKLADLVVYDKNPLENIRNTNTIKFVMKGGELFSGDTLDRILPTAKPLGKQYWQGQEPPVTTKKN
jgi:Tol biopolymer transport system component/imidazolonepropionase-like amidohydrolase